MAINRKGAALAEVLIAVCAFSIAVPSVMSLYLISVSRTIKGHHITMATIVRQNAQDFLEAHHNLITDPDGDRFTPFVFDPLGFHRVQSSNPGLEGTYGNNGTAVDGALTRIPSGVSLADARQMVVCQDSWDDVFAGIPSSTTGTSATVATGAALPALPPGSRVVIQDQNTQLYTATRPITTSTATQVNWNTPFAGTIGQVKIQVPNEEYTWLATAHNAHPPVRGDVEIAVFYKRDFSSEAERVYTCAITATNNTATVTFSGQRPNIKAGGFILDVVNGYWHRVEHVVETNNTTSTITLAIPPKLSSTKCMVPVGVVDVFPMGPLQ